jgi:nicotinamide mononucleotide transporter
VPATLIEWIAVVLALAYVLLAIRQIRWCWPAAAASAAIYFVLFARGGLPMQAALQLFYIAMGVYGWWAWRRGAGEAGVDLPVSRWSAGRHLRVRSWPARRHALALSAVVLATVANVALLPAESGLLVAGADAFVAWGSVFATWLTARKVLENWLYWIVFDVVAALLYFAQGFHATAGLFVVYVVLAARGFVAWRADLAPRTDAATGLPGIGRDGSC